MVLLKAVAYDLQVSDLLQHRQQIAGEFLVVLAHRKVAELFMTVAGADAFRDCQRGLRSRRRKSCRHARRAS